MTIESQAFLDNIARCVDGVMYTCLNDKAYTVTYISEGFERIFKHDTARFLRDGGDFAALIHPDDLDDVGQKVTAAIAQDQRWQIPYRLRMGDGNWRAVMETGLARRAPNGEVTHLDCIILDVATANDLAERIRHTDRVVKSIGEEVRRIMGMLETLRVLSMNARIEAARSGGASFNEVARQIGEVAGTGNDIVKTISTELETLQAAMKVGRSA